MQVNRAATISGILEGKKKKKPICGTDGLSTTDFMHLFKKQKQNSSINTLLS